MATGRRRRRDKVTAYLDRLSPEQRAEVLEARREADEWDAVPAVVVRALSEMDDELGALVRYLDEAGEPAELLGYEQAARVLGIAPRTLRRLVKEKKVAAVRVGHAVRFSREALVGAAKRGFKAKGTSRLFSVRHASGRAGHK